MKTKKLRKKIKHQKKKLQVLKNKLKSKKSIKRIGFVWYDRI